VKHRDGSKHDLARGGDFTVEYSAGASAPWRVARLCTDGSIVAVAADDGAQWQLSAAGDELVSLLAPGEDENAAAMAKKEAGAAGTATGAADAIEQARAKATQWGARTAAAAAASKAAVEASSHQPPKRNVAKAKAQRSPGRGTKVHPQG